MQLAEYDIVTGRQKEVLPIRANGHEDHAYNYVDHEENYLASRCSKIV